MRELESPRQPIAERMLEDTIAWLWETEGSRVECPAHWMPYSANANPQALRSLQLGLGSKAPMDIMI